MQMHEKQQKEVHHDFLVRDDMLPHRTHWGRLHWTVRLPSGQLRGKVVLQVDEKSQPLPHEHPSGCSLEHLG